MSVALGTVKIDVSDLVPEIRKLVNDMLEECAKAVEAIEVPIEGEGVYRFGFTEGYRAAKEDVANLLRAKHWKTP